MARAGDEIADAQIFSLSKTLGLGGGGLLRAKSTWQVPVYSEEDTDFGNVLEKLKGSSNVLLSHSEILDRILREDLSALPPRLAEWLTNNGLEEAIASEFAGRRQKLLAVRQVTSRMGFPGWMKNILNGDAHVQPGILPVPVGPEQNVETACRMIQSKFAVEAKPYHFDVSADYLCPDWRLVVTVPLHSEIPIPLLESILSFTEKRFGFELPGGSFH